MKKNNLIYYILFCSSFLFAERFEMTISYLGFPVVLATIHDSDNMISVRAKATKIASIAASMDNYYYSLYEGDYLPLSYQKKINQKDYREDFKVYYDRRENIARRQSYLPDGKSKVYPINIESRDFFSALFYLRKICHNPEGTLWLDANGLIWKASFRTLEIEHISSKIGKRPAYKVEITFQQISSEKKTNTDMLTNNLVNEDRALIFWFSADEKRLPLQAKFHMKPFPVIWKLEHYDN